MTGSGHPPPAPLDTALVAQTVPAGTMRYYAWLFTPADRRDIIVAMHLIDDELRSTARSSHHDVAHTRLRWWHDEVDRLARGHAAHPATRVLGERFAEMPMSLVRLQAAIEGAAMDLARVTYENRQELDHYLQCSGGTIAEFIARGLLAPVPPSPTTVETASGLGTLLRRTEILRNVQNDVTAGRVYFPLDELDGTGISVAALRAPVPDEPTRLYLRDAMQALRGDIAKACDALPRTDRRTLRPLLVLASLHERLLDHMARDLARGTMYRRELAPLQKLWTAWRTARRTTSQ